MILAYRFKMPLQEFQQKTTSTEFNDWNYFFEHVEPELYETWKYYLAQIAYRIVWVNAKATWKGTISDFLIKFKKKIVRSVEEEREIKLQQSKSFWGGLVSRAWESRNQSAPSRMEQVKQFWKGRKHE